MIYFTLPNGSIHKEEFGALVHQIALLISERLACNFLAIFKRIYFGIIISITIKTF